MLSDRYFNQSHNNSKRAQCVSMKKDRDLWQQTVRNSINLFSDDVANQSIWYVVSTVSSSKFHFCLWVILSRAMSPYIWVSLYSSHHYTSKRRIVVVAYAMHLEDWCKETSSTLALYWLLLLPCDDIICNLATQIQLCRCADAYTNTAEASPVRN